MIFHSIFFIFLLLTGISSCRNFKTEEVNTEALKETLFSRIMDIPLPEGFSYMKPGDSTYAYWLLNLELKNSNTVYMYNGRKKEYQHAQFAVLDIDIGTKDLIQCADAAMKLRADFLFQQKRYEEIKFIASSGDEISFSRWLDGNRWKEQSGKLSTYSIANVKQDTNSTFRSYMEFVYTYCGTYSLSLQLKNVDHSDLIKPGDLFIKGGFPGHAVTVMAVAMNKSGKKIFLLSQGYMPAQDIHILQNFGNPNLSPWYDLSEIYPLYTPQWIFESGSLKSW